MHLPKGAHATAELPESLVRYVVRTEESVILDDASSENPFSSDPYIVQRRPRSILCLPLINQAKLIRILLLENNLTRNVFAPDRVTFLKVLASQAAISLENSRLYRDLEDREGKIRRLVNSNIIGVFVGDFDGRIVEANDAFLRIVGCNREDLDAGRINWQDLTPLDWGERDAQWIEEHKRTGVRLPIEKEYFRKDGSRVPVLLGSATFEEGGNQFVAFVLDLTERKRAERAAELGADALRRSEAYLSEAQSMSHTGSSAYNETAIFYWSDENYRIFGFDPRDGLPSRKAALERIHPDDRERVREEARQAVEQKKDYKLNYRILLPDGNIKYVETDAHPKFSASGELVEVVSTIIDVTERKRAEDALRESEQRFRDYAQTASDWYWETDPDHKFTRVTDYERLVALGFAPVSRIGLTRWEYATDVKSEPEKWELHRSLLKARQPFRDFVYQGARSDGSLAYYKVSGKPIYDAKGVFLGYRGTGADVTERMRAEDAIRESQAKFRDYAETASDWFWEIGPDHKFTLLTENAFGSNAADRIRHGLLGSRSRPSNGPREVEASLGDSRIHANRSATSSIAR